MARLTTLLFAMWLGVTVSTVVDLEKRIYGGQECGPQERLYHVKLIGTNGTHESLCGGSLISKQWILTAAHCYEPRWTFTAHIGVHAGNHTEVGITRKPKIFKKSLMFFFNREEHDLMLLKLPEAVEGIDPVPLPNCTDRPNIGATVQVAGHAATTAGLNNIKISGSSPTLQCADMNITDYQVVGLEHWIFYSAPGVDTCPGDSGGGLVYNHRIYGVHVRSGKYVCSLDAKAMDLCHQPYLKWINDTIKQPMSKCCFSG